MRSVGERGEEELREKGGKHLCVAGVRKYRLKCAMWQVLRYNAPAATGNAARRAGEANMPGPAQELRVGG